MSQYYYLVASLPYLSFETDRATEPEEFLQTAAEHLTPHDYHVLGNASIEAPVDLSSAAGSITSWQRFDRGLRNELVRLRAGKRGADAADYVRTDDSGADDSDITGVPDHAREAFAEQSPLAGERSLDRARWQFLDELESGHFFDLDRVVIYYLKLQLLARKRRFTTEKGEAVFRSATEKIMNDYYQEQGG